MSEETKTVLLKVELDQQAAIKNLQETEKNILTLKTQQKELNEELKKGKITQDEYVQSKIKLDTQLKQESQSRATLQKAVIAENNSLGAQKALLADLINQREKIDRGTKEGAEKFESLTGKIKGLNDSLMQTKKESGGLGEAFLQFAEKAKVGEFELEKISGILPLLASPALAAGAAVATLGAAYANSAAGAKDLEEAQNQIKATWDSFSNSLGGATGGEGEGLISKITTFGIAFGRTLSVIAGYANFNSAALELAVQQEAIDKKATHQLNLQTELKFKSLEADVEAASHLKEAYDLQLKRDNVELSIEKRLEASKQIVENLTERTKIQVDVLKEQATAVKEYARLTGNDIENEKNISKEKFQYLTLLKQADELESTRYKKIVAAQLVEEKLTNELRKQNETKAFEAAKSKESPDKNGPKGDFDLQKQKDFAQQRVNIKAFEYDQLAKEGKKYNKTYEDILRERAEREHEKEKDHEDLVKKQIATDRALIQAQKGFSALAKTILGERSEEYKQFATVQAIASTFLAADQVLSELPYPADIVASAGIVAEGLANVAEINKAAGGGSFMTKGPTMLLVGDNPGGQERVDVTPISGKGETKINPNSGMLQLAGGGSVYTQGGLVTSQMSQSVNQEIALQNAFKNMPQPVVSWKEGLIVDSRIKVKEKLTRA